MHDPRRNAAVIARESRVFPSPIPLADVDMDVLRRAYSALSDRIADRLLEKRLDFDDVVLCKLVCMCAGAERVSVEAEYLSEKALFQAGLEFALRKSGHATGGALMLEEIVLEARTA